VNLLRARLRRLDEISRFDPDVVAEVMNTVFQFSVTLNLPGGQACGVIGHPNGSLKHPVKPAAINHRIGRFRGRGLCHGRNGCQEGER